MKPRNKALHAEVERIAALQIQIPRCKTTAANFDTTPETVRVMLSLARKRLRKLTNVKIHVEQSDAKMRRSEGPA